MSHFALPDIIDHAGWGPVPAVLSVATSVAVDGKESAAAGSVAAYQPVPAGAFMFAELPFQPFNKNDKLWRVSDWATKEGGQAKHTHKHKLETPDTTQPRNNNKHKPSRRRL